VLAVLVIYRREPATSPTLVSLCRAFAERDLARRFALLIYDNSPSAAALPDAIPVPFRHIHDPANGGLFAAYTAALALAEEQGREWLLLLDQDTSLTSAYLRTLLLALRDARSDPRCAALAPKLLSGNRIVSPARILWGGRLSPVDEALTGMAPWEAMALNSATLLRVSAIRQVGGFHPGFWLDYLDYWLFNRLYRAGYSLYVLDATLHHELSVTSITDMPIARYDNVLLAEGEFYRSCKSKAENALYPLRLALRAARMLMKRDGRRFFFLTLRHLAAHLRKCRPGRRR
jgi:GT2 family glycosyltransferase